MAQITVDNSTRYDVAIDVSGGDSPGSMAVGCVPHPTTTFQEVVDQGGCLPTFHFSAQGKDGGAVRIARADLSKAGWKLTVPATVSDASRPREPSSPRRVTAMRPVGAVDDSIETTV